MPYIPKCWQFSSAQIVSDKKKMRFDTSLNPTWIIHDECDQICPTKCWILFQKDFRTPELPPSILSPFFIFHRDFPPPKKTTVSPNHHLGLPSPANGTGIPCPLKSLGTGKASALMAGLSVDNDTIGPGRRQRSSFSPWRSECLPSDRPLGGLSDHFRA